MAVTLTDGASAQVLNRMQGARVNNLSRLGKPHIGSPNAYSFNVLAAARSTLTGEHLAAYVGT